MTLTIPHVYQSGGGAGDQQQIVYVGNSGATSNVATASLGQATTQVPGIRTGQLLIAQQNQSGQPLTLTPINIDGTQILQVLQQPTQQVRHSTVGFQSLVCWVE